MPASDLVNLQNLFTSRIFTIPNYQRGYAWKEQQLRDLVDDLEELPDGRDHFTGMVVLQRTDQAAIVDASGEQHAVFDVVDGQQRITTLLVLLDAIRREALSLPEPLDGLTHGLASRYLYLTTTAGQQATKLRFADGTQEFFEQSVLADTPSPAGPDTPAQHRLAAASEFFLTYIREDETDAEHRDWLLAFHNKVAHRLKLNIYVVDDAAEVGVIFEVMNNRGRPLSDLDLVKNYILYLGTKLDLPAHTLPDDVAFAWNRVFTNLMGAGLGETEHENQLLRTHWLVGYDYNTRTGTAERP